MRDRMGATLLRTSFTGRRACGDAAIVFLVLKKLNSWLKQNLATPQVVKKEPPISFAGKEECEVHHSSVLLPFISVVEVDDAAPFAGELFLQKFNHPIPDYPRHFIALYESGPALRTAVAYVHYLPFENTYLCGGMCVDTAAYRRMPRDHVRGIREVGSLAEYILRNTFNMLGPCAAIFGSVGDATARNVDLRAGFVDTGEPHLMVVWRDVTESEKPALLAKVAALGSF